MDKEFKRMQEPHGDSDSQAHVEDNGNITGQLSDCSHVEMTGVGALGRR